MRAPSKGVRTPVRRRARGGTPSGGRRPPASSSSRRVDRAGADARPFALRVFRRRGANWLGSLAVSASDDKVDSFDIDFSMWAPLLGRWDAGPGVARYLGPQNPDEPA